MDLHNASIGIIDEDHSVLSRRISEAFPPPYFNPPQAISERNVDRLMNDGNITFAIHIPPNFQRDLLGGRQPAIQVAIDATAMMQAGIGAGYIYQIISTEIARTLAGNDTPSVSPVDLQVRIAFNPNLTAAWFTGLMEVVNNVTMLALILAGAAIIREREHGTDHLLVMPLTPFETAVSKVWANGFVILVAVAVSMTIVIQALLDIPVHGSILLFLAGVTIYLFFATAIGIFLGTVARSMPQFGLLYMLVAIPMMILSGSYTPPESMPQFLRVVLQASSPTHFVSFAQAILFRGAGLSVVWPQFLVIGLIGGVFLGLALFRFRRATAQMAQ
ncbi:ABC transporter permease [Bradyrhizobium sp. CCBAU 051011]|nr:ABC transporter permease [Bradyrhizobium sp. CCBAU 051011]